MKYFVAIIIIVIVSGIIFVKNQQSLKISQKENIDLLITPYLVSTSNVSIPVKESVRKAGIIVGKILVINEIKNLTIEDLNVFILKKGSKETPFSASLVDSPKNNTVWKVKNDGNKSFYAYKLTIESGDSIWCGNIYLVSPSIRWNSKDGWPTSKVSWQDLQKEVFVPYSGLAEQDFTIDLK
jgi:hypothetical protein